MATEGRNGGRTPALRRIAVLLGSGTSSRRILESLRPLIEREGGVELSGVFVEETDVETAAQLPFVRELCRLTSELREFQLGEARLGVSRSIREARLHIESTAARAHAVHSFHTVRGTMRSALRETVASADVTFFEPFGVSARARLPGSEAWMDLRGPVAVFTANPAMAGGAVQVGFELARGKSEDLILLHAPESAEDLTALEAVVEAILPGKRLRIESLPDASARSLAHATRRLGAACLVMSAADVPLTDDTLGALSVDLRCPLLLVRHWP